MPSHDQAAFRVLMTGQTKKLRDHIATKSRPRRGQQADQTGNDRDQQENLPALTIPFA